MRLRAGKWILAAAFFALPGLCFAVEEQSLLTPDGTTYVVRAGKAIDLGQDAIVFELTGTPEELDSFQELARPHGIQELVRTGRVGIARASARKARRLSAIN